MRVNFLVLALACFAPTVTSILESYPALKTDADRPFLQSLTNVPYPQWTVSRRAFGIVPKTCLSEAINGGFCNQYEIYVYDIKFTDVSFDFRSCSW